MFDSYKDKNLRKELLKTLEGKIVTLSMHSTGALVVEHLYLEGLSNKEMKYIFQEFYGAEFRHFKRKTRGSLREIVEDEPKKIDDIAEQLKTIVKKHCEKGLLSLSFVQRLLFGLLYELYPSTSVKCRDLSLLVLPYVKEVAPQCARHERVHRVSCDASSVYFERGLVSQYISHFTTLHVSIT